jgi:hypothetical protein
MILEIEPRKRQQGHGQQIGRLVIRVQQPEALQDCSGGALRHPDQDGARLQRGRAQRDIGQPPLLPKRPGAMQAHREQEQEYQPVQQAKKRGKRIERILGGQ